MFATADGHAPPAIHRYMHWPASFVPAAQCPVGPPYRITGRLPCVSRPKCHDSKTLLHRFNGTVSSVPAAQCPVGSPYKITGRLPGSVAIYHDSIRKSIRHCKRTLPAPSAMIASSGYCRISFFPRADWRPAEAMFRSDNGVLAIALAGSWRGGGGLLFPRVSSLLFSSLVFLKVAF